jgi:hypothetical protein
MEVHFTPEQEAQLAQIAASAGTDPEALVKDAATRLLEEGAFSCRRPGRPGAGRPARVHRSKKTWTPALKKCSARKCISAGRTPPQRHDTAINDLIR